MGAKSGRRLLSEKDIDTDGLLSHRALMRNTIENGAKRKSGGESAIHAKSLSTFNSDGNRPKKLRQVH